MGKNNTPAPKVTVPNNGRVTTACLAAPMKLEQTRTVTKAAITKS